MVGLGIWRRVGKESGESGMQRGVGVRAWTAVYTQKKPVARANIGGKNKRANADGNAQKNVF